MNALLLKLRAAPIGRPSWLLRGVVAALATLAGTIALEVQQRRWIFQVAPSTRSANTQQVQGMEDRWIEFDSHDTGRPVKLHGLWLAQPSLDAPVLLYLHGVRWDVHCGTDRMQRLHELGFSVLSIDYRGFGQSTPGLPSERMACEDARAAWQWLARQHPHARRYVYGHSLGGAIAVHLASEQSDVAGLIVESTFTSMTEVVSTFKWGWLPVSGLITQRFDAASRIGRVAVPILVVHGSEDRLIPHELGRALFDCITAPKRFVLVEGGTHHDTDAVGQTQYREALRELFGLAT